ncbi:hypothetical protein L13192_01432 [Pyrenophora tritici-repentis]|nr:hypothetical protein L13192_01432 [Pyrenophora tritici-repentis]
MAPSREHKRSVCRLEDRFWSLEELIKSIDILHPTNPALVDIEDNIVKLEEALGYITFFSFDAPPGNHGIITGLSRTTPEVGDEIFPISPDVSDGIDSEDAVLVLILRPVSSITFPFDRRLHQIYRLIGDGWISCGTKSLRHVAGRVDVKKNVTFYLA